MASDLVDRQLLRYNPLNVVTAVVERVRGADGTTLVHKQLRGPAVDAASDGEWAASHDPRHWNYWRREAEAYRHAELRASLAGTGLDMPTAAVEEHPEDADLWLEDVAGVPGADFALADHTALATSLGRWQAAGPLITPWTSQGFLRSYSASKAVDWRLLEDEAAWAAPLIRATWPAKLREGWVELVNARQRLLAVVEHLPRTRSHLDCWVANQIRRPDGQVVLLDWAFVGDGAVGEDLGNHIPDAAFDLFWPAENLPLLDQVCFAAYLGGLREAGWSVAEHPDSEVRLGVVASCVKYAWLLPRVLARAGDTQHTAYDEAAEAHHLYAQRGMAFAHLVDWCREALRLLD